MLRDYADSNYQDDPYSRSDRSGASSPNWRKNQGYNLSKPTPPELGGSFSTMRDAATNPYYDPGWAQSVRRDNPSQNFQSSSSYNGYNDPYNDENRGYERPSTYPGMTSPRRTEKMYTNPTNPYYDPVWSQSYERRDEPIREGDHTAYYAPGYDRNYYPNYNGDMMGQGGGGMMGQGGGGGYYDEGYYGGGGGGGMMGGYGRQGGQGMYATSPSNQGGKKAVMNGNSLMRTKKNTLFQSLDAPRSKLSALKMAYYDGPSEWDGPPPFDGPRGPMMPPPGYGRGMPPGGQNPNYAGVTTGTGGPYGANQMNPNYYRRGGGSGVRRGSDQGRPGGMGQQSGGGGPGGMGGMAGGMGGRGMGGMSMGGRGGMGGMGGRGGMGGMSMGGQGGMGGMSMGGRGGMGMDGRGPGRGMGGPMGGPPGAGYPGSGYGPGPLGRDNAVGRMSLKDMAARTTQSFDAEVIKSMNNQVRAGESPRREAEGEAPIPLSAIYGPRSPAVVDRSPPLNTASPPPRSPPIIDTNAMAMEIPLPQTIQAARSVRPSVVLVTSKGVRKENSQGSGFVVAFDDSAMEDVDDDYEEKDRVHILTSAHVAPPGWKVSVTFPGDPDKQYPATVVGRKLNSDLSLLCVETVIDEDADYDDYPFPPPLVLTGEDVSTNTFRANDDAVPTSEIGSPVYAFGYPMGVEGPTMTSGILSATTKGINYMDAPTGEDISEISKSRPFEKTLFVITDAAMAGGMSGGPLVNSEGVVLGINALVRSDLRALGNYAVSALECDTFLERLEDKRSRDAGRSSGTTKRISSGRTNNSNSSEGSSRRRGERTSSESDPEEESTESDEDAGVAGYRVMLYGYSTDKDVASKALRRVAGLDELRAENAMRSAASFGAGVVDEFYVAETGNRGRAVKAARKSADALLEKLKDEGMMAEVEPLKLLQ